MASQAQISANRKNAQRSTGPRTAAGKAKVALNALSHGLTAVKVVAGEEDKAIFEALRGQLNREWRPGSVLEVMLLDRMAELIWQLRRVAGVEVLVIERMPMLRPPGLPQAIYPLADAMARDFSKPNPTLLRVQMYQARIERALYKAMRELRALQIERQLQDERDDLDEDDSPPVPLPGERLGEGMPRGIATSAQENTPNQSSNTTDAPERTGANERLDAPSPHLTSPQAEGPETQIRSDKTNPISPAKLNPAGNSAGVSNAIGRAIADAKSVFQNRRAGRMA